MNPLNHTPLTSLAMVTLLTLTCLGLTACSFPPRIYRIDIRQGNYIDANEVSRLRVGMSKESVQQIVGTPALSRFFEHDRWDYYYHLKPGNGDPIIEKHLILYFKAHHVTRIEGGC